MFSQVKKIDGWCVALWIVCLSIALYAIWISFPWLHQWVPSNSGELASWLQAIGALAIVWATYQLHNETKTRLDMELMEKKRVEIAKSKIFIVQNSGIFLSLDAFVYHVDFQINLCNKDYVEFKSVEFFRNMSRHIDSLNGSNEKIKEFLSKNSVPDLCIEHFYKLSLVLGKINNSFANMTTQNSVLIGLNTIGSIPEIKNNPIEKESAQFLEQYLHPYIPHITNLKIELQNERNELSKLVFESAGVKPVPSGL